MKLGGTNIDAVGASQLSRTRSDLDARLIFGDARSITAGTVHDASCVHFSCDLYLLYILSETFR